MGDRRYFVGLGTNIAPTANMATMIERLAATFGPVTVSRIVQTRPYRMTTEAPFLNAVATFVSDRDPVEVKKTFVDWEVDLGRDRSHPDCKLNDRPADIDLLLAVDGDEAPTPPDEPYATPLLMEVADLIGLRIPPVESEHEPIEMRPASILIFGASVGETPSAIDHDGGAGHVRVL